MKKITSLLLFGALAVSANALTLDDLCGKYELQDAYGSATYIATPDRLTFGMTEGDTEANAEYINSINVINDGTYLYFDNLLGLTFYAEANLEANTVTIPTQYVTSPTGYSFLLCRMESTMWAGEGETEPSFTEDDAQPVTLTIDADGNLALGAEYLALWNWGKNYLYLNGTFHKTGDILPSDDAASIIGTYTCTVFNGEWQAIWGTWGDENWYKFDAMTGEGMDRIGCETGPFDVYLASLGGNEVYMMGLWWGGLQIYGTYDPATKTITFPLQSVWGGYTLCNSSILDKEVPTADDVVPATAVINADGTITMNYTVVYDNVYYAEFNQTLSRADEAEYLWYAGSLNDWTFDKVVIADNKAVITGTFPEDQEAKIKISTTEPSGQWDGWEGFNAGALTTTETVELDKAYELTAGEADIVLANKGDLILTVDLENNTLTVVADPASLQTIDANDNAEAVYYNLQGIRVNPTEGGIYVVRRGTKVAKVVL